MKKEYKAPSMTIMTVEPTAMLSTSSTSTPEIRIKDDEYADENVKVL